MKKLIAVCFVALFVLAFFIGGTIGPNGNAVEAQVLDTDSDGVPDVDDNCPATPNPLQSDIDNDGIGDACDSDTFFDDFNDTTTFMLPVNPNTLWRQVGVSSGNFSVDTGLGDIGYSVRIQDTDPGFGTPGLGADNARYFDVSSATIQAFVRANDIYGGGVVGFSVYDDTGENICGGAGATLWSDGSGWYFALFDMDLYDPAPYVLDMLPVAIDPTEFHKIRVENQDREISATLDGGSPLSGTRRLPIDVADLGVCSTFVGDFSFDNFSSIAQPDYRHVVFQDVEITYDTAADQLFPTWSHDGKKIAYTQRDDDPTKPHSWNVWVQQIDPPLAPIQCTQPEDNAWIYAVPAFSPDYSHVIFTAMETTGLVIKRANADGTGDVETIISETGVDSVAYETNCNLIVGTKQPHATQQGNLFAVEITPSGVPVAGTIKMLTDFPAGTPEAWDAHLNATCSRAVFMSIETPTDSDVCVLNGVQEILNDAEDPPTTYSDSRLVPVATGSNFQCTGRFSGDGSYVYYCEDASGIFDVNYPTQNPWLPWLDLMQGAHFEMYGVHSDAMEAPIKLNYYRPYNQGILAASPDGTKLVFISDRLDDSDGVVDSDLYIVTLKVQEAVDPATETEITDGSGTTLDLPAGSITEATVVSIQTPLPGTIPSPATLPGGLQNIALARVIEANPETAINPDNPPILTIHYTDEEITGLDELSLRIYVYNEDTLSWEALENCTVDPVTNTVSAPLPHLSMFCVSGALEGTLPVVGSFKPPLTNQEDFALQYGTTLPVKFDIRSPSGAFLPDEPVVAVITDSAVPPNKIATFVRGDGSEDIRVEPPEEHYIFNLHSKDYGLLEGPIYTIVILWNGIPIGEIGFTVSYTKGTGRGKQK